MANRLKRLIAGRTKVLAPGRLWTLLLVVLGCNVLSGLLVPAATANVADSRSGASTGGDWTVAWSRPQHISALQLQELGTGGRGPLPLVEQTVRVIARVTGSGPETRITLSNRYGIAPYAKGALLPVPVRTATIAKRTTGANIAAETLRQVTFNGKRGVSIPVGGSITSDPVALPVSAGDDLAISLQVGLAVVPPSHGSAQVKSYVAAPLSGDHTKDLGAAAFTTTTSSTPILTSVDVRSTLIPGAIAATGGSVTDGTGSDLDGNNDFPALLSARIQHEVPAANRRTVVNSGIAGTTASSACGFFFLGPSVQDRVEADTLSLPGISHLIVYAGTNDIGFGCTADEIIAAYKDIVAKATAHGVKVLISTVTPRESYTDAQDIERAKVNAWVRTGGNCSGTCHRSLDFDAVVRDPSTPSRLLPALDSGDGIHPNPAGYALIANSIPLDAFD